MPLASSVLESIPTLTAGRSAQRRGNLDPSHELTEIEATSDEELIRIITGVRGSPNYMAEVGNSGAAWSARLQRVGYTLEHCFDGRCKFDGTAANFVEGLRSQIGTGCFGTKSPAIAQIMQGCITTALVQPPDFVYTGTSASKMIFEGDSFFGTRWYKTQQEAPCGDLPRDGQ